MGRELREAFIPLAGTGPARRSARKRMSPIARALLEASEESDAFLNAGNAVWAKMLAGELDADEGFSKLKELLKSHAKLSSDEAEPVDEPQEVTEQRSDSKIARIVNERKRKGVFESVAGDNKPKIPKHASGEMSFLRGARGGPLREATPGRELREQSRVTPRRGSAAKDLAMLRGYAGN